MSCTSLVEIVSPRPVPPYWRVIDPSACEKASKITDSLSGAMPAIVGVVVVVSQLIPMMRMMMMLWRVGAYTDARVAHGEVEDDGVGLALLHLNREDGLALRRKLDGIAHQVNDDLPQPHRVAHQLVGQGGLDVAQQLDALLVGLERQRLERVAQGLVERHICIPDTHQPKQPTKRPR
jgi:hypothetical protein